VEREEHLLRDVLGVLVAAEPRGGEALDARRPARVQALERAPVAAARARRECRVRFERKIRCIQRRRSHHFLLRAGRRALAARASRKIPRDGTRAL
jgi:hypothetical protein